MNFHIFTQYVFISRKGEAGVYQQCDGPVAVNLDLVTEIEFPSSYPDVAYVTYANTNPEKYSTVISRQELGRIIPVPVAPPPPRQLQITLIEPTTTRPGTHERRAYDAKRTHESRAFEETIIDCPTLHRNFTPTWPPSSYRNGTAVILGLPDSPTNETEPQTAEDAHKYASMRARMVYEKMRVVL